MSFAAADILAVVFIHHFYANKSIDVQQVMDEYSSGLQDGEQIETLSETGSTETTTTKHKDGLPSRIATRKTISGISPTGQPKQNADDKTKLTFSYLLEFMPEKTRSIPASRIDRSDCPLCKVIEITNSETIKVRCFGLAKTLEIIRYHSYPKTR